MDKYDKISFTVLNNDTCITNNTHKIDTILHETEVQNNKVMGKKSQLLSLDGWKNFQKELIQLCFEFWEVNETQVQVNNSVQSDLEISDSVEIQTPSSLFANKNNVNFKLKARNLDHFSKELKTQEYIEANNNFSKNQHEGDPAVSSQWFSKEINNNISLKINENCSKNCDIRENKQAHKNKLKNFSFYKHMSNQRKPKTKLQSINLEKLDTVEKIKKYYPNIECITSDNVREYVDKTKNNNTSIAASAYSLADVEGNQMEQKVRKLIKSLKEKDKLFTGNGTNEQTAKFGSSNKLKYFFKNAFRGTQDELDLQLLDDYTKYINNKVHTWQMLLYCLEDIRQKECCKIKTDNLSEDTIKPCRLKNYHNNLKKLTNHYDENISKFVEINDDGFNGTGKQRKKRFFNLLNKTIKRTERRSDADDVLQVNPRWALSNRFDGDGEDENDATLSRNSYRKHSEIRKSWSESDLPAMVLHYDEKKAAVLKNGIATKQFGGKTSEVLSVPEDEYDYFQWDDRTCKGLWEERQECFQTAVARLEYVGSTLKEQCQLTGLKTLCKVDVLAGFGHSAEAVDLFVSTLPMSNNPGLMIRKAEAAYDWKFFCHLSMWRHSYKD